MKDILCVDVGNPHLVIFSTFTTVQECRYIAENIEKSSMFQDGIDIDFVTLDTVDLHLRSWERGLNNFSLACGSGACASFAAAHYLGFIKTASRVRFEHGMLNMSFDEEDNILMQGPAKKKYLKEFTMFPKYFPILLVL